MKKILVFGMMMLILVASAFSVTNNDVIQNMVFCYSMDKVNNISNEVVELVNGLNMSFNGDITSVPGLSGEAYLFDGSTGYLEHGNNNKFDFDLSNAMTVIARINNTNSINQHVMSRTDATVGIDGWSLRIRGTGGVTQAFANGIFFDTVQVTTGLWTNMGYTRNDTHITWIVEEKTNRTVAVGNVITVENDLIRIGASSQTVPTQFYDGLIDEMFGWNITVSAEIIEFMNETKVGCTELFPPPPPPSDFELGCLGDSITNASNVGEANGFCSLMNDTSQYLSFNFGVEANKLFQMLNRITDVTGKGFNRTILLGGTNDAQNDFPNATSFSNMTDIIIAIQVDGQEAMSTTIPPCEESAPTCEDARTVDINRIVRRVSYDKQTCYVDIYNDIFGGSFNAGQFVDSFHPNIASHKAMNSSFINAFDTCVSFDCVANKGECYNWQTFTPTNLFNQTQDSSSIFLNWTGVSEAQIYLVYQDGNNLINTTNTTINVTGLSSSTLFSFNVTAFNNTIDIKQSNFSNTISAFTSEGIPISNVTVINLTGVENALLQVGQDVKFGLEIIAFIILMIFTWILLIYNIFTKRIDIIYYITGIMFVILGAIFNGFGFNQLMLFTTIGVFASFILAYKSKGLGEQGLGDF